ARFPLGLFQRSDNAVDEMQDPFARAESSVPPRLLPPRAPGDESVSPAATTANDRSSAGLPTQAAAATSDLPPGYPAGGQFSGSSSPVAAPSGTHLGPEVGFVEQEIW